jgi:hypothetical protein
MEVHNVLPCQSRRIEFFKSAAAANSEQGSASALAFFAFRSATYQEALQEEVFSQRWRLTVVQEGWVASSLLRRPVCIKRNECSPLVWDVIAGQGRLHLPVSEKLARARLVGRLQPSDLRRLQPATS